MAGQVLEGQCHTLRHNPVSGNTQSRKIFKIFAVTFSRLRFWGWALALLERVITRLRDECAAEGKEKAFEQLKPLLTTDKTAISYPQAAVALGISEDTARVTVHRLRKRYRQVLRDAIAQTLADPAQVDEEMLALSGASGR